MKNIAIIPARSGSKGLKNKNIKELCGKPLLAYSILSALESNMFTKVFVSTDSESYADIARQYGAEVPFLRSDENSSDIASSWDTVREVLLRLEQEGDYYDTVCLLQPTSPLRTGADIIGAYELYCQKDAKAVVSVSKTKHSPLISNTLDESLCMGDFLSKKFFQTPRQLLPQYYIINGAVYIINKEYLFSSNNIYGDECFAYVMDENRSVDIDDEVDFVIAEYLLEKYRV